MFKNVSKKINNYLNTFQSELKGFQGQNNKAKLDLYNSIEEYCAEYFSIPSIHNNGVYKYNKDFANKYFIGALNVVGLNQDFRQQIISLDSVNRRYKWIYEYTDSMTFENPCEFVKIAPSLVKSSDSLALEEIIYVLSDYFDKGSRLSIVCNSKNDTIPGIVIGKTLQKNNKIIEIIETPSTRRIDKAKPVLIKIDRYDSPYLIEKEQIDYKFGYDDYFKECEDYKKDNGVARSNNKQ